MNCKKCEAPGTVVLRRKDHYCENCFVTGINHKFRSCIGKNRAISPNAQVLVCLSGGTSSTVLLDMIHNGISLSNHKKLRIKLFCLHLIDNSDRERSKESEQIAISIVNQCKLYDFNVYMIYMSEYIKKNTNLPEANIVPTINNEPEYQAMLNNMPATVKNDFVMTIKRHLFLRTAEQLKCDYIFTAESTSTLAISLLSNLTVGRGAQVQDDVGFCDARHEKIKILRPMKDISKEELHCYKKIKNLSPADQRERTDNSLQSVISTFVTELQDNFQATISTVCKTADKIGTNMENEANHKCIFCKSELRMQSELRMESTKLTALEATNFSRIVSLERPRTDCSDTNNIEHLIDDQSIQKPMFPFINERLCYSCSRNYLEMDHSKIPLYIQASLQK